MRWTFSQNFRSYEDWELLLSSKSLTFAASGATLELDIITNIPQDQITYEVNSSGIFTVSKSGYKLTISTSNLGTTIASQQSSTLTVKARNLTATCTLIRQANVITQTKIIRDNGAQAVSSFSASGGFCAYVCENTFTSGSKNNGDRGNIDLWSCSLPGAVKNLYTIEGDGVVWKAVSFTIPSKGDIVSDVTNFTITTTDGIGATLNCTQAANIRATSNVSIRHWTGAITANYSAAALVADATFTYSSGSKYTGEIVNTKHGISRDTVVWSGSVSWAFIDWDPATTSSKVGARLTFDTRGSILGSERSVEVTVTVHGVAGKKTFVQPANIVESLEIRSWVDKDPIVSISAAGVGATWYHGFATYTSTTRAKVVGDYSGWITNVDWIFLKKVANTSDNAVSLTINSRGTTVGPSRSGTLTFTYGGKSDTITLTQAENKKTYGAITILDFSYPVAGGGASTISPVVSTSQAVSYSSGSIASESITGSRVYRISATPPPSYVTINNSTGVLTWQANTSGSTRSVIVSLTITSNGESANNTYNASQSASIISYSDVTVSLSYTRIPAKGGTVSPSISYSQTWGYNGSTTGGGTITTGGVITYSGATSTNGNVTTVSKGSKISDITNVATVTASVHLNGKSGQAAYTVQQEANWIDSLKIGGGSTTTFLPSTITYSAAGGSNPFTGWVIYSSGAQANVDTWRSDNWILSQSYFTKSIANGILTVTGEFRGTTVGAQRSGTLTLSLHSVSTNNKTIETSLTLTQAANNETEIVYGDVSISKYTYSDIPASGGNVSPTLAYSQTKIQKYSSGGSKNIGTITSGATLTYSKSGTAGGGSINTTTGIVSVGTRGTTVGNRWEVGRFIVLVRLNGKEGSTNIVCYQQENKVVSTEYAIPVISTFSYPDIPAKGGTVLPTLSWSQTIEDTYTSEESKDRTITTGGTITYSGSAVNPQTGSYTQGTKGTTESARNKCITATVTVVANGRTGTKTTDIYQAANTKTTTYSDITIAAFGYPEIPAGGSIVFPTLTYTQTKTDSYSSGSSIPTTLTSGGKITYSGATNNTTGSVTASSRGTTEGSRQEVNKVTVTVALNSRSASSTVSVFQEANKLEKYSAYYNNSPDSVTLGYEQNSKEVVICDITGTVVYTSGQSRTGYQIPVACEFPSSSYFTFKNYSGPAGASGGRTSFEVVANKTNTGGTITEFVTLRDNNNLSSVTEQIAILQETKPKRNGTLQIQFLGTAPYISWYVTTKIMGSPITGPTRYTVQSSTNAFNITETELAILLARNPGSGDIEIDLASSNGGSPSYRATLTQPQAASLSNGINISLFAYKLS